MKLSVCMPEQIIAACVLLQTLFKNGFCMEGFQFFSANNNNICSVSQFINFPWKVHFELVNRSANTIFSICKRQELYFFTTLNDGVEELKVKFTKT